MKIFITIMVIGVTFTVVGYALVFRASVKCKAEGGVLVKTPFQYECLKR